METPDPSLLTPEQTAQMLGVKTATLSSWRHYKSRNKRRPGGRPVPDLPFIKCGTKLIRYTASDVQAFIDANRTTTTPVRTTKRVSPGRPRKNRSA